MRKFILPLKRGGFLFVNSVRYTMNKLQIYYEKGTLLGNDNAKLLRSAGCKRLTSGWYTVCYRGVNLDNSTICAAKRNKNGQVKQLQAIK